MLQTATAKSRLEAQLAELEHRQKHVEADLAEPLNPDSSEQAVEMEDDEALEGQSALISREITSVKRALRRIEDGTYGACILCGAEIAQGAPRCSTGGGAVHRLRSKGLIAPRCVGGWSSSASTNTLKLIKHILN